ncbi:MAG: hypothetical protein LBG80_12715 [Bacteroidales bacterium]|nr:hypothetical protein [Bacteroidales bacterium]
MMTNKRKKRFCLYEDGVFERLYLFYQHFVSNGTSLMDISNLFLSEQKKTLKRRS